MSFLSDDDSVQLEEEAYRKHLLQTPIRVRVEVCVDVATSEKSPSSDQGFVTTSTVTSPSVPESPDLQNICKKKPPIHGSQLSQS